MTNQSQMTNPPDLFRVTLLLISFVSILGKNGRFVTALPIVPLGKMTYQSHRGHTVRYES